MSTFWVSVAYEETVTVISLMHTPKYTHIKTNAHTEILYQQLFRLSMN